MDGKNAYMFQRAKNRVHLPYCIIDLEVESIQDKVKQDVGVSGNMFPGLSIDKISESLPHPRS